MDSCSKSSSSKDACWQDDSSVLYGKFQHNELDLKACDTPDNLNSVQQHELKNYISTIHAIQKRRRIVRSGLEAAHDMLLWHKKPLKPICRCDGRNGSMVNHHLVSDWPSTWLCNVYRSMKLWSIDGVVVELCCGTKSVGSVFEHLGIRTVSVDYDPRWCPDVLVDIAQTTTAHLHNVIAEAIQDKYGQHLEIICFWASPQCTEYSRANTTPKFGNRDLINADRLVQACLDLFQMYPAIPWFLENPWTGLLKDRPLMRDLQVNIVDYCKYSSATRPCCHGQACPLCSFRGRYKKETGIWTNTTWKPAQELCRKGSHCNLSHNGAHIEVAGGSNSGSSVYPVPGRLVSEITDYVIHRCVVI